MGRRIWERLAIFFVLAFLVVPGTALACLLPSHVPAPLPTTSARAGSAQIAAAPATCPGVADASFSSLKTVTGEFTPAEQGSYVMVPFTVPAGTTAVRVRYCHDQPEAPTNTQIKHVLDLGIYDARSGAGDVWDEDEFRGWGGSSHPDVTVSPNGFSSEAQYSAAPRAHVHGTTTRGFEPGPIPVGEWAVELGVAAVATQLEGDSDGRVAWLVQIESTTSADYADDPLNLNRYQPTAYDTAPAKTSPGWYAGDFHVHAEHSSLGDATMTETFNYAFRPIAPGPLGGAGLDFITLSDYVTDSAWGEIGRYQDDHPGKLIVRSAEVITYQGHANNHASNTFVDYRTGPILLRNDTGTLAPLRAARPASAIFDAVHAAGGWTQINHPTIFPSEVPGFDFVCRGCPWDYSNASTDYSKVDAIEIATGPAGLKQGPQPGPNPFTPLAVQFWEEGIDANGLNSNHIAAVGSSDSHRAGRANDLPSIPSSPIGQATTVVHAPQLSEQGIEQGVEAGHTYVKIWGNDGPDLRLEAKPPGSSDPPAIMGDTIEGDQLDFTAKVLSLNRARAARPGSYELIVYRDGSPLAPIPIPPTGDSFEFSFPSTLPGRYRLQVQRGSSVEAVSSPIYQEPSSPNPPGDTTRPTASVNAPEFASDRSKTPTFRLRWGGEDDFAGSGIDTYTVDFRRLDAPGPAWQNLLQDTTETSANFKGAAGARYEFRVRAKDKAGNQSDYARDKTTVPVDDRLGSLEYTGAWRSLRRTGAWLRTISRSASQSARVRFAFDGGRLFLIGTRTEYPVRLRIRIERRRQIIDIPPAGQRDPREVLFRSWQLRPDDPHTAAVIVVGGHLELDALGFTP